jgi:hypothetical protein
LLLLPFLLSHLRNRPFHFPLNLLGGNILKGFADLIQGFKVLRPFLFQPGKLLEVLSRDNRSNRNTAFLNNDPALPTEDLIRVTD